MLRYVFVYEMTPYTLVYNVKLIIIKQINGKSCNITTAIHDTLCYHFYCVMLVASRRSIVLSPCDMLQAVVLLSLQIYSLETTNTTCDVNNDDDG